MNVAIKNADGIVRQLRALAKDYPAVVARSFSVWGNKTLLPRLQKAAPVGATGHTQGALRVQVRGRKQGIPMIVVAAGTAQAVYRELGTVAHAVNPRYKKALRIPLATGGYLFIGPRLTNGRMLIRGPDGKTKVSRKAWAPAAWIPRQAPHPWFYPTIDDALPALDEQLTKDIDRAISAAVKTKA